LQPQVTPENADYLRTKFQRMNHLLNLEPLLAVPTHHGYNGSSD
jgi:hypothetical protein